MPIDPPPQMTEDQLQTNNDQPPATNDQPLLIPDHQWPTTSDQQIGNNQPLPYFWPPAPDHDLCLSLSL